jgi:localization factor PodJL
MTYDDDSEWRRDDRPSWRREASRPADAARAASTPAGTSPSPSRQPRNQALRVEAPRIDAARGAAAPAFAPRPAVLAQQAAAPLADSAPVTDIAAMVDRIISQLDAVERARRPGAAPRPAPRPADRRDDRAPPRGPVTDMASPPGSRPFTAVLRQQQREKARTEPRADPPREQAPSRAADRPALRPQERSPAPVPADIDRHFRSLAERVEALRQRTDDRIAAVRDDVARLSEAVLARPVASLAVEDRAALDALASRLARSDAFGPETLARIDAVQSDLTALGRTVVDLDLDRRLYAIEAGQGAILERLGDTATAGRPDAGIDVLRRRLDGIAERLDSAPAPDAVAALDSRLARLAGEVRRIADAPVRTSADECLARDVAAMRAELTELTRGGIVAQFDEIGSALARLAGEVKTAARSAGAEAMPVVADLVRRIEKLDRRLDDLAVGDREDRLHEIERAVTALDRRHRETRPPAPPVAAAPVAAAPVAAPSVAAPSVAAPFAPVAAESASEAALATRTSRLIAAARRAVEHPILRRGGDASAAAEAATDAAAPGYAASGPAAPSTSDDFAEAVPAASPVAVPGPRVVDLAQRRAAPPEPDVFAPETVMPFAGTETAAAAAAGAGTRRMLLLAAAVVGLVGGAYGFASEPLRALVLTLSGSETTSTVAARVPTLLDPRTTGSIVRAPDGTASGAVFSAVRGPVPGAATLPTTLGSPGLREAAAGGDPRAALEVGVALLDGVGVTRDPGAAVPWLTVAADGGLAPAEFRLGTLYERGIGVARSRDTARAWYDRAAGRGHVKAMHNLAVLLSEAGEGRDLGRAVAWFEKAARHGLVDSQFNLAVLYVRGLGVAQDPVAAYRWFALAARQGDQEAAVRRDEVGKDLSAADRGAADLAIAGWTPLPADGVTNDGPPLPQQWTHITGAATRG